MAESPVPRTGVLVMDYGTPGSPAELEAYYTHIRHGRPPPPDLLARLRRRYEAIGGTSPLREISRAQAAGIQASLDELAPDTYRVYQGSKHAPPFVEDAVQRMRADGVTRAVAVVLAPHFSKLSVGEYLTRASEAAGGEIDLIPIRSWHLAEGYLGFLADEVSEALTRIPEDMHASTHVLFTAHSLPERVVAGGDRYAERLRETAEAVAARVDLRGWSTAWQSAGATPEPWLGPDVLEVIPALATDGVDAVVVCACGFVADHLEVLYDLDIEARRTADQAGLAFDRTAMPNDDPRLTATLAELVVEADRAAAAGEPTLRR